MSLSNPVGRLQTRRPGSQNRLGPVIAIAAALAVMLVSGAVMQPVVPPQGLAPVLAGMLFALAAVVAAIAWLRPSSRRHFDYWDAAGLLTFIGILVAAAVEPGEMVEIVGGRRQP
jgi:hypothetical protein